MAMYPRRPSDYDRDYATVPYIRRMTANADAPTPVFLSSVEIRIGFKIFKHSVVLTGNKEEDKRVLADAIQKTVKEAYDNLP